MDRTRYGPWALIAGASEGVGVSLAHQLGAAGFNLVLLARQGALLADLADRVRAASGVEVRVLAQDMTAPDMLDTVAAATDDIEVGLLICNAGATNAMGPFLGMELSAALRVFRVNPIGQAMLAHHFGQGMAARGRGGIILMGSLAGNAGMANVATYSAAKAGTQMLAEALWAELKPLGIDVLCYILGATDTPTRIRMGADGDPDEFVSSPEDVARDCLDRIADGPVLTPDHLSGALAFFSSPRRREAVPAMNGAAG